MTTLTNTAVPRPETKPEKRTGLVRYKQRWGLLFISPWVIGFLLFYLLPMIASFGFSLTDFNLATPAETRFIALTNWRRALVEDTEVIDSFIKTFKFSAITLPAGLIFALFLALLLNSRHVKGKIIMRTLFYAPIVIPGVATTLIWSGVLNEHTGWINLFLENIPGVQAVGVEGLRWLNDPRFIYYTYTLIGLWGIGNAMIIMLAGLQSVPTELYEAAEIDGASYLQKLVTITLPLISPVIFYNVIIGLIGLMQYFLVPFVLNGGDGSPQGTTRFIAVWFYKQSFSFFNMGYGATIAWLIFMVALLLTVALFGSARYWVYYATEE
ncbi:MAG: sugar ABC transporter permease [Chloroflexi bacterium]|nr:sugar ABC transporter permease [Chloroflexota bacterium]MCI0578858.1 sugar ABC transporter permease [Chloroflexota bacterium]MCI0643954.1 sugar ABC transporter permease [Chloroflexota bacterium]